MNSSTLIPYETQNEIRDILIKVGLSARESEIFVCLCNLGPQAGSVIAKNVGMKRTTVYHSLQRLVDKGFVYPHKQSTITYFHLNSVTEAISKLELEKDQLKEKQSYLEKISKMIHDRGDKENKLSKMKYREFKGIPELKKLKMSTLKNTKELLVFANPGKDEHILKTNDDDFWKKFNQKIASNKLKVRMIVPDNHKHKKLMTKEVKIVPKKLFPLSEIIEVNILTNRLVIIGSDYGVEIENIELATIKKSAFELAWRGASEIEKSRKRK